MRFPQVTQIVSLFEARTPLHVFLAKIVVISLILYFENLGTAIFKKQSSYTFRSLVKTVENSCDNNFYNLQLLQYNLPENLIKINSIEGVQPKVQNNAIS